MRLALPTILIAIVALIAGCTPKATYNKAEQPNVPLSSPTPDDDPTPTPTPAPTATPSPTATATPTPSASGTPVPTPTPIPKQTFLIFGNAGTGSSIQYDVGQQMWKTCQERGCNFALMLGDNIMPFGVFSEKDTQFLTKFEYAYEKFGWFNFWGVFGNHDHWGFVSRQIWYSKFSPRWRIPARYYKVPDMPDWLNIYGLDTYVINDEQIAAAKKEMCHQTGWKIVMGHHPVFSNGKHGDSARMNRKLVPFFQECDIHIYLTAHDKHQEHITAGGYEEFIQGAAAKKKDVKIVKGLDGDHEQKFAASEYGFAVATVTEEIFEITFYDYRGKVLYNFSTDKAGVGLP